MRKIVHFARASQYWDWIWYGLIVVVTLVILNTFQSYGVTSDADSHVGYGRDIAKWYVSFFTDFSVFNSVNTWLYGGFFDLTAHFLSFILPFDIYDTRHLYSAVIGILGVVAAYRIGCVLGGKRAGVLAAVCLILTPRYYGHAFNNTKDIPFAVFYLWGLYYLIRSLGGLPQITRSVWVKLGVVIGLTMAIRANGLVLFFYMGLFWCIRLAWMTPRLSGLQVRQVLLQCVGVAGLAYGVLFPFWPWLQIHPLTGLWDGFVMFASFSELHFSFFEGHYVGSDAIPWYYAPKWLLLTLPEFVIAGLMFSGAWFLFLMRQKERDDVVILQWGVLWFGGVFPVFYGIVAGTPLYDGLRQMLFVMPPLVVLSAVGFDRCVSFVPQKQVRWCAWCLSGALLLLTLWDMNVLHPNQYVYFNRAFAGGIKAAERSYETDYWNHTYKQGIRWVEAHAASIVGSERKPTIGSLYPNLKTMVDTTQLLLTEPKVADFYLGNTRYDLHRIIPGKVIHTIEAQGVPLLYVIQPDDRFREDPFFDISPAMHNRHGDLLRAQGDLVEALDAYEWTLERLSCGFKMVGLDSSGVLHKMGNVLLGLDRYDEALAIFDRIPDRDLFAGAVANNLGMYFVGKKEFEHALYWLEKAVGVAPSFYEAHVSLGTLYLQLGDTTQSATVFESIAEHHTKDSERQFKVGNMLYALGRYDAASMCFERMTDVSPYDEQGYYYMGLAKAAGLHYASARDAFIKAIVIDPYHVGAHESLAAAYMHLKDFKSAVSMYEKSLSLVPNDGYLLTILGIAQMNLRHYDAAKKAFHRALEIDPSNTNARHHLGLVATISQ